MSLAAAIKRLRVAHGWTAAQLDAKTGMDAQDVTWHESGSVVIPRSERRDFARAFGKTEETLVEEGLKHDPSYLPAIPVINIGPGGEVWPEDDPRVAMRLDQCLKAF